MRAARKYLLGLMLTCIGSYLYAQHSTFGTDFWLSFGKNSESSYSFDALDFQVRIVAFKSCTVSFSFTDNPLLNFSKSLAAGEMYTVSLKPSQKLAVYASATSVSSKTLRITSTEPVAVYAMNLAKYTSDASNILPVAALGTEYFHISYEAEPDLSDGYIAIAAENGTTVYENGSPVATLQAGQAYSAYYENVSLTGTLVTSSKPIAYFVVNDLAEIPLHVPASDCLYQQLAPAELWGRQFLVPSTKRGVERIRIMASQNGTLITVSGGVVQTSIGKGLLSLNRGEFAELEVYASGKGCYISSNNPIAVGFFLVGLQHPSLTHSLGDPAMAWTPPIEQCLDSISIAPFYPIGGTSALSEHYALIVTPTATKGSTTVATNNGAATLLTGASWVDNVPSGYSFCSYVLDNALYHFANPAGLTVMGYGLGNFESYCYLSGAAIKRLSAILYVNDINYKAADGKSYCHNDSVALRVVVPHETHPAPGHVRWVINGTEELAQQDKLQWKKLLTDGSYTISVLVKSKLGDTDTLTTTLNISQTAPIIESSTPVCVGQSATITLSNQLIGAKFEWYNNSGSTLLHTGTSFTTLPLAASTSYTVVAGGTCAASSKVVTALALTHPTISVSDTTACSGSPVVLTEPSPTPGAVYEWYDSTGEKLLQSATTFSIPSLDSTVSYVLKASNAACPTNVKTITVNATTLSISPPVLSSYMEGKLYASQLASNAVGPSFTLSAGSLPMGLALSSSGLIQGTVARRTTPNEYALTVRVEDENGCTASKEYLLKGALSIPEVFSPNSDGVNDYFMKGFRVAIFDRLGVKLFEGNDGWDGSYKGKAMPPDSYFYVLYYTDDSGSEVQRTGCISILKR